MRRNFCIMNNADTILKAINSSLDIIEQEREKEIISRRFGLDGHKETLEQIGDMLSITRERVRQLEKAILIRLRIAAEESKITELAPAEKVIIRNLTEMGRVARTSDIARKVLGHDPSAVEKAYFNFLGEISSLWQPVPYCYLFHQRKYRYKYLQQSSPAASTPSLYLFLQW